MPVFRPNDRGALSRRGRKARRPIPPTREDDWDQLTPDEQDHRRWLELQSYGGPLEARPLEAGPRLFAGAWSITLVCIAFIVLPAFVSYKASFGPLVFMLVLGPLGLASFAYPFVARRRIQRMRHALTDDEPPTDVAW